MQTINKCYIMVIKECSCVKNVLTIKLRIEDQSLQKRTAHVLLALRESDMRALVGEILSRNKQRKGTLVCL